MSRQLATSSENLVASTQFLVALVTSEMQFRALDIVNFKGGIWDENTMAGSKVCSLL